MEKLRLASAVLLASATLGLTVPAQSAEIVNTVISIPAGTGYTSLDLCTRINISADNFVRVRDNYTAPMVQPLPSFWSISNNPGVNVTTSALGLVSPRTAAYRKGLGCTVVKNSFDEWLLRTQAFTPAATPAASTAPWPAGEGAAETQFVSSAHLATLNARAADLFSETTTDVAKKTNTYAVLVAKNGHLVYERYATGYNRNQPQIGWSMTKSLTAMTAGLMEKEGRLGVDQPVGLKRWAGTSKAGITWRQLLNMASGQQWAENATDTTPSNTYEMLFNQYDNATYAADQPLAYTPGTHFEYSTGAQTIAMAAMKEKLGGTHQAIYHYYQSKLFAPLGIRNGIVEPDYSGTPIGGARGVLRPVDWMRLGQLVVNNGMWNGQQLLSPNWMQFMKTPSPTNPGYAGSIWTRDAAELPADIRARLPADTVYFGGHLGQFVVMVPSRNLVVVRMGVTYDWPKTCAQVFGTVADLVEQGM